jgi:hypothetical protein
MNIIPFIRTVSAVTPSDTAEIAPGLGLYIGGAGAVKVMCEDGTSEVFAGFGAGGFLPGRFKKVFATGTTATLILAVG